MKKNEKKENNKIKKEKKSVENKDRKEKVKRYEKKIGSEDLIEIKGSVEIFDDKKEEVNDIKVNFKKSKNLKNNEFVKKLRRKSNFKLYELLFYAFLLIIISVSLTFIFVKEVPISKKISNSSNKDSLEEFMEVYNTINETYYDDVDKNKILEGAIDGMLSALGDPHTSYFSKNDTDTFNELMNGSYEGIGAEITINSDKEVIVLSVFKNSPADKAGLKYNDVFLKVNGKSTENSTPTEVAALIKDSKNKIANILIRRDGKEMEIQITKEIVTIESVEAKTYKRNGKKIGYVLVNNFANNTPSQFKEKVEALEEEGIYGLVIDVRGNSGGYLHSVTNMLDMFLPKGKIIYQMQDKDKITKYKDETFESRNYPIAVLVNKSSASASEILAVTLKEVYGADVVGTYTYGKGTVQVTKSLASGAMIKYTTQKWLSPNGNWINEVGVKPTHEIELQEEYSKNPTEENDNQLQKALDVVSK